MMCSYQTLARYHDDHSAGGQSSRIRKSLEDIRLDHRHAIHQARLRLKCSKMLKNRRIFEELAESESSDAETYYDQDDTQTTPSATPQSALEYGEPSSSAWDSSSQASSYHPSPCSEEDILAYFLDTPSPSPAGSSVSSSQNSHKPHQPFRSLKELNRSSNSLRQRCILDSNQSRAEFNALKEAVSQPNLSQDQLSLIIHAQHHALVQPLRTFATDELPQVLDLLSTFVAQQSLKPETLLMILQQGLMMQICNVFARQDTTCDQSVMSLIINIVDMYPAAVPFMIDSMTTSNFWNQLKSELQMDNVECLLPRLQIYHKLTSFALSQLFSHETPQPLLPPVLLQTGVSKQTLDSYSPLNTLHKLYSTPETLALIKEHCLVSSYYNRPEIVTTVLQILATAIQSIHVMSSIDPSSQDATHNTRIAKLLNALEGSDQCLADVITCLNRTIRTTQFSEHSSQGVGTNASSVRSLNHCQQFLTFFSQYYTPLATRYAAHMTSCSGNTSKRLYKPLDL